MFDIDKVYGFFYNTNDKLSTKQKSDNDKLDYIRAILESPSSTKSFLSPGNFDTLKANNDEINKAKKEKRGFKEVDGKLIEDINLMNVSAWVQIADQMNTGKALIGVAANANAAHAIFQHAVNLVLGTMGLDGVIKYNGFMFDGEMYAELTKKFSKSDRLITKNIAELLAAFVDNGKDPQAKYSNINNYTIDVAVSMALVGIDLETIQYFLTQDIIEDFVTEYRNLGGNIDAENKVKDSYGKEFNINLRNTSKLIQSNFTTKELKAYSADPKSLLETFLKYKEIARPVSNLVTAIKQGENGLGPTDSHNLDRLDKIDNADNFDGVYGAMALLQRKDLFPYHFNEVIRNGRKVIIDKAKMPDRNKGAFLAVRQKLRNLKKNMNLTVNQIDFIVKNYIDYLASNYNDLKFDKQLIADLPKRLQQFKKKNPDKYNLILSRLQLDVDKANNITYIVYTGLSGQDKHLVDRIRDDWESMLLEGTEEEVQLAKDLIKYTYMMSGFRISPQSFSHLSPVLYYSEIIPDFSSFMRNQFNTAENIEVDDAYIDQFYHQFIRNHFRSLSYIPNIDLDTQGQHTLADKQLATVSVKDNDFKMRDGKYADYIKTNYNKENILLVKHNEMINKENGFVIGATYVPASPLGTYKSKRGLTRGKMFTHYTFGADPVNIFKQNKVANVNPKVKQPLTTPDDKLQKMIDNNEVAKKCKKNGV